jgi:hypothetical protein
MAYTHLGHPHPCVAKAIRLGLCSEQHQQDDEASMSELYPAADFSLHQQCFTMSRPGQVRVVRGSAGQPKSKRRGHAIS